MIQKYKHKPIIVEAIQYTGNNAEELIEFGKYIVGDIEDQYIDYPSLETVREKSNELWISDFNGGDIIHETDYAIKEDGFIISVTEKEFKENWVCVKGNKYLRKNLETIEAIKWTENNTEEIKDFLDEHGTLDRSGKTFIILNTAGGAVAQKGYYVIKTESDFFTACDEESLKENFELEDRKRSVVTEMDETITPPINVMKN